MLISSLSLDCQRSKPDARSRRAVAEKLGGREGVGGGRAKELEFSGQSVKVT